MRGHNSLLNVACVHSVTSVGPGDHFEVYICLVSCRLTQFVDRCHP